MCIEKKDETLNNVLSTVEDQIIIACYPHDITNLARFCVTWFEDTCLTIYTGKCNEDDSVKTIAAVCIDIHNWKFKYKELEVLSREVDKFFEKKIKIFAIHNSEVVQDTICGPIIQSDLNVYKALVRWEMLQ